MIGDGLVAVTVGLFVTRLTGNPADVGLVLAGYAFPLVLLLPLGGVTADRWPRQLLMIAADSVRAAGHGVLAVLVATGTVRIWHLTVVGVLFGTAWAFFYPAYAGLVPQTVAEGDIQGAQALGGVSRELASFVGPALATVLVFTVGGAAAFGLDAVTFAFAALTLTRVRARPRGEPGTRHGVIGELREGWVAVRERPWVWATIAGFSVACLLAWAPFLVLGASVAGQVYGTDAVYGLVTAVLGLGTAAGALVGARWRPRRPMLVGLVAAAFWPALIALFAAGLPRIVLCLGSALAGLGLGLFAVWWETALAQRIPPHLLSRVAAWDLMGSFALLPLGYLLAGPVAAAAGDVLLLVAGGSASTVALLLALVPRSARQLSQLDAESLVVNPRPGAAQPGHGGLPAGSEGA